MHAVHVAAVDLGATSGRVIVGSLQEGRIRLTEVHRFANAFRNLGARSYWDIPYLWDEVRRGLVEARRAFPRLASVGVDSWAVDHVLVGADGRPVYPVHAYRDPRTGPLSRQLEGKGLKTLYRLTGVPNYPYNTSLQLAETLEAAPGLPASARRCLFVSDYFNYLLSGRMANELSIASHSQLLSASEADWSPAALRHFGIPAGWFERPLASPRGLGVVRGLPELKGVKSTLVPGHDTACAFASMPADPAGADLYLSTGTWSLIGCESERPLLGDDALEARISNERMGDGRFRPLRSCLGLWLLERLLVSLGLKPASARDWKALIDAAAATRPPAAALDVTDRSLFSPPDMKAAIEAQLRRRRLPAPKATAGWIRLVLHSLALGHADGVRQFERLTGRTFDRILIVGGGSRNPLLCQATADAAGVPVVSFALEGSAMGNVGSQLIALGELENLAALRHSLTTHLPHRRYTPSAG